MIRLALLIALTLPAAGRDCETCLRTKAGAIFRSRRSVAEFRKTHPCPATGKTYGACKGYVVDHIVPLACADDIAETRADVQRIQRTVLDRPENMQWQTRAAAGSKDRWERNRCIELYRDPKWTPGGAK